MMTERDIYKTLTDVLQQHVGHTGPIAPDMQLQADLHLDSLQLLTFVVETENAFGICFAPEAEAQLCCIADVVRYIKAQKSSAGASDAADVPSLYGAAESTKP